MLLYRLKNDQSRQTNDIVIHVELIHYGSAFSTSHVLLYMTGEYIMASFRTNMRSSHFISQKWIHTSANISGFQDLPHTIITLFFTLRGTTYCNIVVSLLGSSRCSWSLSYVLRGGSMFICFVRRIPVGRCFFVILISPRGHLSFIEAVACLALPL